MVINCVAFGCNNLADKRSVVQFHGVETLLEKRECIRNRWAEESVDAMTNEQKEAFKKNDTKAKCIIVQCISDKHLEYIKDTKSAVGMSRSLKMCSKEKLRHFYWNSGAAGGYTFDESDKVCYLLLTMPEKYDIVITAIETITRDITLEFVKSRLLDAELKFKDSQPEDDLSKNCAFNTGKYLASRKMFECEEYGHFYRNCPKNSKEMETSDSDTSRGYTRRDRARSYGRGWRRQANMTLVKMLKVEKKNTVELPINLVTDDVLKFMTEVVDLEEKRRIRVANGNSLIACKRENYYIKRGKDEETSSEDEENLENMSEIWKDQIKENKDSR
ncbi:hypothetical protein NQ314_008600 [Rhamnusium bicolor]|uniref:CCHC-type domain-containing protein n=1 Tax=Rhamnusium bicolor TaxID=1586634 RepID=A0AAV8Y8B1_9CUCU|nr:hypothetical protein NQ314_008600 [Rhamnusium bicolor]